MDQHQQFVSQICSLRGEELVEDLLQRITLYDLKADTAEVRELADGRFETIIDIEAEKFYADGQGKERKALLEDSIEIGLFAESDHEAGAVKRDGRAEMPCAPCRAPGSVA